jgi:two-component system LytT family response regulator
MSYRALIVDDEELARQRLAKMLGDFSEQVEIIGEASDGLSAVDKIDDLKPDLVFLDIQMPGLTGFEVLSRLQHNPQIIFTTAYDQYALQAFDTNAVGYLLKPIEKEKLSRALSKLNEAEIPDRPQELLQKLASLLNPNDGKYLKRIQVRVGDRILLLGLEEVLYFESEDKYTSVVTEKKKHIIDTPLVELEERLDPERFTRIHRSCLVNIDWVTEIHRHVGGKLQLQLRDPAKTLLTVSRSFVDRVRNF